MLIVRGSTVGVNVGWCLQEVLVGTGPFETMGIAPIPTIATGASIGEATITCASSSMAWADSRRAANISAIISA
jgi:hypothetical protein